MSEQRALLAETVERLFREAAEPQAAVSEGWNEPLWAQVEEMGIPLLLVPEEAGGIGGVWEDALVVLQAQGRHAVALPVAEAMLAARLLAQAGLEIPSGALSLAPRASGQLQVDSQGDGWRFSGQLDRVPWGRNVASVVAVCVYDEQLYVVRLATADATLQSDENLAGEPRDQLRFENAPVLAAHCDSPEARQLIDYCALLRVGQTAGAMESALARSIQYAQERSQFGRPLAKFQAVQQQLAVFGAETAAVGCAARAAFRAADRLEDCVEAGLAKLRANLAINVATATAHQVHGAIGFTHEYDLRHATQRLWSWRTEFGNDRYWSERLGAAIASRGADAYWIDLTARGDRAAVPAAAD